MANPKKTQILPPVIIKELTQLDMNTLYLDDDEVYDTQFSGGMENVSFYGNRNVDSSIFDKVRVHGCKVIGYNFTDVIFTDCDFSNTLFLDCSFHRTEFVNCKFTGTTLEKVLLLDVRMDKCRGELTAFINAKFKSVIMSSCSFIGLNLYECTQQKLYIEENDLEKLEVYHTSLKGVDLSLSKINGCVIPLESLKGAQISFDQAALVAIMLGIKVI